MSRLVYYAATTLDGFIADPDDDLSWLLRQPLDKDGSLNFETFLNGIGAIVMGSTTYEWILQHHPDRWDYPMPAWVMTTRQLPLPVAAADVRFASGDVRAVYEAMAEAAGEQDMWVVGGGELAGRFAEQGLLDEVVTYVAPVVLGAGKPLLPRRLELELVEAGRNQAFLTARYRCLGPLRDDTTAAG